MSLPAESTGAAVTQVDTAVTESPSTTSIDTTPPPLSSQRSHRGNLVLGAALIALGVVGFGLSWLTVDAGTLIKLDQMRRRVKTYPVAGSH